MASTPVLRSDLPTITLRSPGDLVALTPYLLGFHPAHSVVVVAFQGQRAVFAARGDLPDADGPAGPIIDELIALAARQAPDRVAVLGYGSAAATGAVRRAVPAAVDRHRLRLLDVLRVDDGRWWSDSCPDPRCCPPEGTPIDVTASEVSARCTVEGLTAAPDRQALAATVAPLGGPARIALQQATDQAERDLQRWLAGLPESQWLAAITGRGATAVETAITRYADGGRLDDAELAWLSLLLVSIRIRDAAWRAITTIEPHLRLWTDVTRRAAPKLVAAPASLLAFTAWRAGNGTLALLALQRALADDPTYSMALLLRDGLQQGLHPSLFDSWGTPRWQAEADLFSGGGRKRGRGRSGRRAGRRSSGGERAA